MYIVREREGGWKRDRKRETETDRQRERSRWITYSKYQPSKTGSDL